MNYGVIHDGSIGGASQIPFKVVRPDGDWRQYVPEGDIQHNSLEDYMACVTFSLLNSLEVQTKELGGDVDLSQRFTAKMSNTTPRGNWQYIVADSVINDGVVSESDYEYGQNDSWAVTYQEIPASIKAKAVKVDGAYQFIPTDIASLKYHLQQAPIQITIPTVNPYHAVLLVHIDDANNLYIYDSYPHGQSTYMYTMTELPASAMKFVLNKPISMNQSVKVINVKGTIYVGIGISDPKELETFNRIFDTNITVNADGSIPSDFTIA